MALTPEAQARTTIDAALQFAGWDVQDMSQVNVHAAPGVAMREFPLKAGYGTADYLLYVNGKAAGALEAKKAGTTLSGVEIQTEKYSAGMPDALPAHVHPLPFLYQSTGVETFFTNRLDPEPRSRRLFHFHRPETLADWLQATPQAPGKPSTLRSRLQHLPPLHSAGEKLRDSSGNVPVYGSSGIVGKHTYMLTSRETLIIGRKGSVGEIYYSPEPCWAIDTTYFAEGTESTYLKYWFYLLKSLDLGKLDRSTAIPGLSRDDYNKIEAVIAPLPEQHRIVAEIETQFTRLDATVAAFKRAQANLKRYRASVLQAACTGRLVPTEAELARAEGRTYESADQLLQRILQERRAKWEAEQLAAMQAKGKTPTDNRWKSKYREPVEPDTRELPELPEGWVWATVEQLASPELRSLQSGPFGSNLLHSEFRDKGVLAIGIDNVLEGRFSMGSQHRISLEKYKQLEKYAARPLDVLVTVMATVGRCCVVPANLEPAIITKHVYRISANKDLVAPPYLMTALRGGTEVREQIFGKVQGQTRPGINGEILRRIAIPIPPLLEQHRIVAEVERRLSVIDALEATIATNLQRAERLRQAILKRAFEGKLVPQDPTDEPASVLLERIRLERARATEKPKATRQQSKKSRPIAQAQATAPVQGELDLAVPPSCTQPLGSAGVPPAPQAGKMPALPGTGHGPCGTIHERRQTLQ